MAWLNHPNHKKGKTVEEREEILERYHQHIVIDMCSMASFSPTFNTMKRLAREFKDFRRAKLFIEDEGIKAWELLGVTMAKTNDGSSAMFGIMTRNKRGFRAPKEKPKDEQGVRPITVVIETIDNNNPVEVATAVLEQNSKT